MSESKFNYKHEPYSESEKKALARAARILEKRIRTDEAFSSPDMFRQFIRYKLAHLERECFAIILMCNRNRYLGYEVITNGCIDSAQVSIRAIGQLALHYNAASIVCLHNHPSSLAIPSEADEKITIKIREAMSLLNIRLIDHFIVGNPDITSFAERGLL